MSLKGKMDLTSLGILWKNQIDWKQGKYLSLRSAGRNRLLAALLAWLIVCNMVFAPQRSDAAVPLLAAPEVALGAFVGVVAVGAIGMELFGYAEQSDKAMAYAAETWKWGNAAMKKAVVDSYNAAVAAGNKVMTLSADVARYWADGFASILSLNDPAANYSQDGMRYLMTSPTVFSVLAPTGTYFVLPGGYAQTLNISDGKHYYSSGYPTDFGPSHPNTRDFSFSRSEAWAGIMFAFSQFGTSGVTIPAATVEKIYGGDLPKIRAGFPLSLPLPTGQDFIYTPVANPGVDVHMRNDGTLADDAGKVYSPDQVKVKATPIPRIAKDAAGNPIKDAAGNPVIGVPVGAVGVGDAAIPGTLVNVRTGEAVQTKTGDTVANPPLDWSSQPTESINWGPLKLAGGALTKKFPFSIPWDIAAQLRVFDVQPKTPVIAVDQRIPVFATEMRLKFTIDFSLFNSVVPVVNWFLIIAGDLGMILAIRKFMPE